MVQLSTKVKTITRLSPSTTRTLSPKTTSFWEASDWSTMIRHLPKLMAKPRLRNSAEGWSSTCTAHGYSCQARYAFSPNWVESWGQILLHSPTEVSRWAIKHQGDWLKIRLVWISTPYWRILKGKSLHEVVRTMWNPSFGENPSVAPLPLSPTYQRPICTSRLFWKVHLHPCQPLLLVLCRVA